MSTQRLTINLGRRYLSPSVTREVETPRWGQETRGFGGRPAQQTSGSAKKLKRKRRFPFAILSTSAGSFPEFLSGVRAS